MQIDSEAVFDVYSRVRIACVSRDKNNVALHLRRSNFTRAQAAISEANSSRTVL